MRRRQTFGSRTEVIFSHIEFGPYRGKPAGSNIDFFFREEKTEEETHIATTRYYPCRDLLNFT